MIVMEDMHGYMDNSDRNDYRRNDHRRDNRGGGRRRDRKPRDRMRRDRAVCLISYKQSFRFLITSLTPVEFFNPEVYGQFLIPKPL